MHAQPFADAAFYDMIHHLLQEQGERSWRERRQGTRQPYNCIQLLAPYNGRTLPAQSEFGPVQCQDLSAQGFSFLVPHAPKFEYVVVALGAIPFTFFAAQVVRVIAKPDSAGFFCGCRFLNRISGSAN